MKIAPIALGLYQVLAAIGSLVLLSSQLQKWGLGLGGVSFLFCALSFAAGIACFASQRVGWTLSFINQAFQALGIFTPAVTFMSAEGLAVRVYGGVVTGTASALDWRITGGYAYRLGADFAVALMKSMDGFPTFGITINFIAVALLWLCWRGLKTPNQALEPTSPAVTDRAGARSAPAGDVAHL